MDLENEQDIILIRNAFLEGSDRFIWWFPKWGAVKEKKYRPLKVSDLKGSSLKKGSEGTSLEALLLNMAIFDLKDSSW